MAALAGEPASSISLPDSSGRAVKPLAKENQKATVLVFMMHDCPVTNASTAELARLADEFTPRGIRFFGIYTTETAKEISAHRREYGLAFEGLLDPDLNLARFAGATRAPEAAVIGPDGALLYRGRIDDRAVKPGTMRPTARQKDLRLALEAVVAGKKPDPQYTTAIGCYLPSK